MHVIISHLLKCHPSWMCLDPREAPPTALTWWTVCWGRAPKQEIQTSKTHTLQLKSPDQLWSDQPKCIFFSFFIFETLTLKHKKEEKTIQMMHWYHDMGCMLSLWIYVHIYECNVNILYKVYVLLQLSKEPTGFWMLCDFLHFGKVDYTNGPPLDVNWAEIPRNMARK